MDFTSFAAIEFADAFAAEREYERNQRKWLIQWQDLRRAADATAAAKAEAESPERGTPAQAA